MAEVRMGTAGHASVIGKTKPALINYVAAIFAAIGSFLFGYDSGIISSVISPSYGQFQKYFHNPQSNVTGAIVSTFAGGAFFGALLAGRTADWIGRKRTIQLGSIIAIIGCTLQTAAVNIAMLIVGRCICGAAIGVLSMIVPMYQAEISPPHARGLLSGMTQWMISWGFFIANWVGYGCGYINNTGQFRVPLAIQIIPALLLLIGMFILPYSPRWLVMQGRVDEARDTLYRLHGGRKNAHPEAIEAEFQEISQQVEWDRENLTTRYIDLVNTKPNFHRTFCGCAVQAMCQWTGVNVNNYFGPTIYTDLGYTGHTTLIINAISGTWGLIVTFIFITCIVDRIGRRWPLIIGALFCAAFMGMEAGTNKPFSVIKDYHDKSTGIAGVAAVFLFSWAFSFSFGPVSWIYQSEIFPMNIRALGTSVSTATNWANNVVIGQITPIGFKHLKYKYFFVFVATNFLNIVIAYMYFPETKNRSLEEIGLLFGDENVRYLMEQPSEKPANTEKLVENRQGKGDMLA
ncbi:general substrate transporter [Kockovaella imperatae]|uniref:General substrate transporter n=1 Tax=Kockovaella imperatae TaxID=4999 RepID=A0A1Y1UNB4_9TREE|nr:general substrate transporter [Kockovaella imperatae]ORX39548.1 general substrate transporter [Kockovaella imperatae]